MLEFLRSKPGLLSFTALTFVGGLSVASCTNSESNPTSNSINHNIKEPRCTGYSLIPGVNEQDPWGVEPTLRGSFENPSDVLTYLVRVENPSTSTSMSGGLINVSEENGNYQLGVGYIQAIQYTAPQVPVKLKMFDFQENTPPSDGEVPIGVPEIDCPTVNLGQLVIEYNKHTG